MVIGVYYGGGVLDGYEVGRGKLLFCNGDVMFGFIGNFVIDYCKLCGNGCVI